MVTVNIFRTSIRMELASCGYERMYLTVSNWECKGKERPFLVATTAMLRIRNLRLPVSTNSEQIQYGINLE